MKKKIIHVQSITHKLRQQLNVIVGNNKFVLLVQSSITIQPTHYNLGLIHAHVETWASILLVHVQCIYLVKWSPQLVQRHPKPNTALLQTSSSASFTNFMNRGYNFCKKGTTAFPEAWIISAIVPIEKDLSATELVSFCNRTNTCCTPMLCIRD